jgi:isoleucyl-tRNA synthetase
MSESLRLEGMARELINRLQNTRKELGFEVTDKVDVLLTSSKELDAILKQNKTYIQHEILATNINTVKNLSNNAIELSFDSLEVNVQMVKSK